MLALHVTSILKPLVVQTKYYDEDLKVFLVRKQTSGTITNCLPGMRNCSHSCGCDHKGARNVQERFQCIVLTNKLTVCACVPINLLLDFLCMYESGEVTFQCHLFGLGHQSPACALETVPKVILDQIS